VKSRLLEVASPRPSFADLRTAILDEAFADLETRTLADGRAPDVLDAGCGAGSPLRRYRQRIGRFAGADLHDPAPGAMPYLDAFVRADLCRDGDAFAPASIDLVLSNFTMEHFGDPERAVANMARWLRPGGHLIVTTVNRRHPFVGLYLSLPGPLRTAVQRFVRPSDAHPLVGACNDPRAVAAALRGAGLEAVRVETVGHLGRAWQRRWPTLLLGLLGDIAANPFPGRRSTIVAIGSAPAH
jgi:SAM-dependent methyltransferase